MATAGMKPSIPQIQGRLRVMACELVQSGLRSKAKRLRCWATQLSRVKSIRRAPVSVPMPTPSKVRHVRAYRQTHPDVSYRRIANLFGVGNDGRVSEIMRGKRGRPIYDALGRRIAR